MAPRKLTLIVIGVITGVWLVAACSSSSSGNDEATGGDAAVVSDDASQAAVDAATVVNPPDAEADAGAPSISVTCAPDCTSADYCLGAYNPQGGGPVIPNNGCVPLPAGCSNCECAITDATNRTDYACSCTSILPDGGAGSSADDAGLPLRVFCTEA